jgi:hypothetical protein
MIDAVKQLTADEQRQLLRLLNNTVETARLQDDAVLDSLVDELRNALAVPAKDDLPEYLRRRLVQVARDHFSLGDRFDTYDDVELAVLIVDFVVDAAAALASQDMGGARDEFETFLRTKKREERVAWLIESERLSTLARDGVFDEAAARRRAALISSQDGATAETASTILSDVAAVTGRRKTGRKGRSGAAVAAAARIAGTGGAAAIPLSAVAGGLYMAGRATRELVRDSTEQASKTRAQRARNSKQVQATVALCAFVVAHQPRSV